MKINIQGLPEDLIRRCKECSYCIFEHILSEEQRKIKVLQLKHPEKHIHRIAIEQLCGKKYDDICPMKYAAMKATIDDRTAMQMGAVKNYIWDLGKQEKHEIQFDEALKKWSEKSDKGRGIVESYASRYKEIWDMGIRKVREEDNMIEKQLFTSDLIYEFVITKTKTYDLILITLEQLRKEHIERDAI